MRKTAGSRPFGRPFLWVSLGLACLVSACAIRPAGFDADTGANGEPPMFRNLAGLPEKPPAPEMDAAEKAKQALTADRATAAAAADELRREPFAMPDPPPPKIDF